MSRRRAQAGLEPVLGCLGRRTCYLRPPTVGDEDIDAKFVTTMIDGGVPLEGWRTLAEDFLDRFER